MWGELAHSLQNANGYVITILLMGFVAAIIFFERLIMYQFVYHINFDKFLGNLRKMVSAEDMDRATTYCKNTSTTALPHIGRRALEAAETDPSTVKGVIEEESIKFLPRIETRLAVLPAFTLLIMLVGILGTIDSLWAAFHSVDVLDTAKKQATLAQGIAGALNPTAIGLLFGMILLAGHQLLKSMAVNLTERIHYGVSVLSNLLVPQEAMVAAAPVQSRDLGGGRSGPAAVEPQFDQGEAAPAEGQSNEEPTDDAFDDVSVEDIKDEEEII